MAKEFAEWIGERRKVITLPSGIEAEVRRASGLIMAEMGPLPGIQEIGERRQQVEISRRYVSACLVRLAAEKDPIRRGLVDPEDFSHEDLDAIVDAVVDLVRGRGEDAGGPLAGTASPGTSPGSSTESASDTGSAPPT